MSFNRKPEKTAAAWVWRILIGPAQIVDGVLSTLTLGSWSPKAALTVSRLLVRERMRGADE